LAYSEIITEILPKDELIGELVRDQLIYYPTVTREPFRNQGRITALMESGKLFSDVGLPPMNRDDDRFMLCGSPQMIAEVRALLDAKGWQEGNHGEQGQFVIEKAFVEK
jgi:ferredoxin--NADP+ reductase